MTRTLYEIGSDMAALETLLLESGGDMTDPAVASAIDAWEAELETNLVAKLENYICLIQEIEARADARTAEARRIADLSLADQRASAALRERLRFVFATRNIKPVQTERFRVALAKNGGKAPLDIRVGVDELPAWAVRRETVVTPDKDAIRARIEAGDVLSFASLLERGNRISIK